MFLSPSPSPSLSPPISVITTHNGTWFRKIFEEQLESKWRGTESKQALSSSSCCRSTAWVTDSSRKSSLTYPPRFTFSLWLTFWKEEKACKSRSYLIFICSCLNFLSFKTEPTHLWHAQALFNSHRLLRHTLDYMLYPATSCRNPQYGCIMVRGHSVLHPIAFRHPTVCPRP